MTEDKRENQEIKAIKDFTNSGRIDEAVKTMALYFSNSTNENYLDRLERVLETLITMHGGRTVLRFAIEHLIIDIPSLLENLSKADSVLRYSFLILLKPMTEELDLFLPFSENLLKSADPNVREATLQLIIFMASGEKKIEQESLIKGIATKLTDDKEFVIEKAIQALNAIGKNNPSLVTHVITNYIKEHPENENLKKAVDIIFKNVITFEKIEKIVEEKEIKKEISEEKVEIKVKESDLIKEKELEIIKKENALKKKTLELKKKELKLKTSEKEIDEKEIQEVEKKLKETEEKAKKKDEDSLIKELELIKTELELKKKKIELEAKEIQALEKQIKKEE